MAAPDNKYNFINNKTCPYCQSKLKQGADFTVCSHCGTPHHTECWNENGGCTTYGCTNNPQTETKFEPDSHSNSNSQDVGNETVESLHESIRGSQQIPAIETIPCPNCKEEIESGSVYCKFCGYNVVENKFDEAKDEFEKEYKKRYKDKVSVTRTRLFITIGSAVFILAAIAFLFYITINKLNEYFDSDDYKIKSVVYNWKDSWEDKDLDKYRSFLTEDYEYYGKDGKKVDLKEKLRRIDFTFKNYKTIDIRFSDYKMINDSTTNESDKKVQFNENYDSEKFKENGVKTLRLYKGVETNGEWKIYREIFE